MEDRCGFCGSWMDEHHGVEGLRCPLDSCFICETSYPDRHDDQLHDEFEEHESERKMGGPGGE